MEIIGAFANIKGEIDKIVMSRILIITPKEPSTNPRMRKAADALAGAGHEVHVLYASNSDWGSKADKVIFKEAPWSFELIGGDPFEARIRYFFSRLGRKISETFGFLERAHCRSYAAYVKKGLKWNPDIVIGHNPGALGPLTRIASQLNIPSLFDAEDFHRGETASSSKASIEVARLETKLIPLVSALTAASPLIGKAYEELFPAKQITVVNNAFPLRTQPACPKKIDADSLQLVWFSQVVGLDRGLEEFLFGMALASDIQIDLTLIGLATDELKEHIHSLVECDNHHIHFLSPMSEESLFKKLGSFEIGLALEVPTPTNRDICRTNKLYTYPISGCHMLVSKTKGQLQFMDEFPASGTIIDLKDPQTIADAITDAFENRDALLEKRQNNWELAKRELNWEKESRVLVELVETILKQ